LLYYQNNYVEAQASMTILQKVFKQSLSILAISLSVLYNYFDVQNK